MKTKLFFLFILVSVSGFAQDYIFGKISTEEGAVIPNTTVINMRTEEKTLSDNAGNYMIAAKPSDELRFVRIGYERNTVKVRNENYSAPLNVLLLQTPYLIEEVQLGFHATGNLKKDVKYLDPPQKVEALNSSMRAYVMTPPSQPLPKLTIPSAFAPKNLGEGQMDVLGLVSAVSGLFNKATKAPLTTANYAETQAFFQRIKSTMDLSFYTSRGWDEEQIDRFLLYADRNYSLAKKYRKTFDVAAISSDMKMAYQEYIKTHKVGS